jgi:hypothetical protein
MVYSAEVKVTAEAEDHSEATRTFTELTEILKEAGYGHISTTILDVDGEIVADFA